MRILLFILITLALISCRKKSIRGDHAPKAASQENNITADPEPEPEQKPPESYFSHNPRKELILAENDSITSGVQVGFSAEIQMVEGQATVRYEFTTGFQTKLTILMAYNNPNSTVLISDENGVKFNHYDDPNDVIVGKCEIKGNLGHKLNDSFKLIIGGSGADAVLNNEWLTSINRVEAFYITKNDTVDGIRNKCMNVYQQQVRQELQVWAETNLQARPAPVGDGLILSNGTGAVIWVTGDDLPTTEIPAWSDRTFASSDISQAFRIQYGSTCYDWIPEEEKTYDVVLLPIGYQGCDFNWNAGCLEVTGDQSPPIEHSYGCEESDSE